MSSAHIDTFARDHLPPPAGAARISCSTCPTLQFPAQLNCATELLDRHVAEGRATGCCIQAPGLRWTYADLQARANRIAHVLVRDMGLVPGNRVLLRAPNNPMLAACWFAVVKAGGIAVGTMPLLRAKELKQIIDKAQVTHALCDLRLADELKLALPPTARACANCASSTTPAPRGLEAAMARARRALRQRRHRRRRHLPDRLHLGHHRPAQGHDAFPPRRDGRLRLLAAARAAADGGRRVHRQPAAGLHLRPGRLAAVPDERGRVHRAGREGRAGRPAGRGAAVRRHGAVHRAHLVPRDRHVAAGPAAAPATSLRKCVSAGEALPAATRALWKQRHRHRDHRRHRRDRDAAHLHLRRRSTTRAPAPPARWCRATSPA